MKQLRRVNSIAVIHFQLLEKFPPAMNLLNFLGEKHLGAAVFSTGSGRSRWRYENQNHCVRRLGKTDRRRALSRYIDFAVFNLVTLFHLFRLKPKHVLYYDTLSVWPAYVYKLVFPATCLMGHHHEYNTLVEYQASSRYLRWLHNIEKKALLKADWVSHTNADRLKLFAADHPGIAIKNLRIFPNYPPLKWFKTAAASEEQTKKPTSFVYVGSLGLKDSYLTEFVTWIRSMEGSVTLDIFSMSIPPDTAEFLHSLRAPYIRLKSAVNYFDLPSILPAYEVGVVLYKGSNLNMKYNVPNKVMEYYACGLTVWCSDKLASTSSFKDKFGLENIRMVDFESLSGDSIHLAAARTRVDHAEHLSCESVYLELVSFINESGVVNSAPNKIQIELTR